MAQIKKISIKTVHGAVKLAKLVSDKKDAEGNFIGIGPVKLMRVFGRGVAIKKGVSDFGEWKALQGQFRAINNDGEVFDSSDCFLPDVALNTILVGLVGANSIDFAMDIFAGYDPSSSVQYTYSFEHILPPAENDPLLLMQNKIAALMLPAPTIADLGEQVIVEAKEKVKK